MHSRTKRAAAHEPHRRAPWLGAGSLRSERCLATLLTLRIAAPRCAGNLYALSDHHLANVGTQNNPKLCGMVPLSVRYAHGYNPHNTGQSCPVKARWLTPSAGSSPLLTGRPGARRPGHALPGGAGQWAGLGWRARSWDGAGPTAVQATRRTLSCDYDVAWACWNLLVCDLALGNPTPGPCLVSGIQQSGRRRKRALVHTSQTF